MIYYINNWENLTLAKLRGHGFVIKQILCPPLYYFSLIFQRPFVHAFLFSMCFCVCVSMNKESAGTCKKRDFACF